MNEKIFFCFFYEEPKSKKELSYKEQASQYPTKIHMHDSFSFD